MTRSFNTMVDQLEERAKLKEALDLAMEVQQNLLPLNYLEFQGMDIAGTSIYCDETGGDYFDFLQFSELGKNRIGIAVGDVVGHGIAAALLMTTGRALLRSRAAQPGSPAQMISDINRLLCLDTSQTGSFMTLFFAVIDSDSKDLVWVRAGHDAALVYDPSNDKFRELRGEGLALGVDENWSFEEYSHSGLTNGQIILIGTDGIWETENPQGEAFGKERLRKIIHRHRHLSAQAIISAITTGLSGFRQTATQRDDITPVVVKAMQ